MQINVPIKPLTVNKAFHGRHKKTNECKAFEWDLWRLLKNKKQIKGMVEIEYKFYLKNHKLPDYDNMIKVMQDILVKRGYIEDDRKIYKATIYKIPAKTDSTEITINAYELEFDES